jgi:SAM-dependent methyltransferase
MDTPRLNNRLTVESYERCALDYAAAVSAEPSPSHERVLVRLLDALPGRGMVLEVGSGPGWDADFLEHLGARVRRTDATRAFVDFQISRGRQAELLDLISDDFGGPYDGVMALYVLQHIDRCLVADVLHKVAEALRPGGVFLVSLQEGSGEFHERGTSGCYRVVRWSADDFAKALSDAGLGAEWVERVTDEADWMTILARRIS